MAGELNARVSEVANKGMMVAMGNPMEMKMGSTLSGSEKRFGISEYLVIIKDTYVYECQWDQKDGCVMERLLDVNRL